MTDRDVFLIDPATGFPALVEKAVGTSDATRAGDSGD